MGLGHILWNLAEGLKKGEEINSKLLARIEKMETDRAGLVPIASSELTQEKAKDLNLIEKALTEKLKNHQSGPNALEKKNNYGILTEILPYSDRREIKVKFRISDIF